MNTTKERLMEFLQAEGISQARFATAVDVSRGYVNAIVDGIKSPVLERIKRAYPMLSLEWLVTGDGSMYVQAQQPSQKTIPILTSELCKEHDLDYKNYACSADAICGYQIPQLAKTDMYAYVQTDAMRPRFEPGDLVAFKIKGIDVPCVNGSPYLLHIKGVGFVLRRVYDCGADYDCRAYNKDDYTPFSVRKCDVSMMALAIGLLRTNI